MRNKAIDAAIFNEPWATQQEAAGVIKKVLYIDDVDPNGDVSGRHVQRDLRPEPAGARNYLVG